MRTKEDIVNNWLPRYTGKDLEYFRQLYPADKLHSLC